MDKKINILAKAQLVDSSSMLKTVASKDLEAQPDLLYMRSLLVSTGANKNDDVFLPEEMWQARNTPKLKPVDWEHNTGRELSDEEMQERPDEIIHGNQIIGVIYNTYATDGDGKVISDEHTKADDFKVPDDFHIVDEAVIYKALFPKSAAKIENGAARNELFVSMEAWFHDYDYLVGNKVVARNEETAFLDRSLRANGGDGRFGNDAVKRILRKITFGGKGIVERPANEPSVIQSVTHEPIQGSEKNQVIAKNIVGQLTYNGVLSNKEESNNMSDKETKTVAAAITLEDYKDAMQKAMATEHELKTKSDELNGANEAIASLQGEVDTLKSALSKGCVILNDILPGIKDRLNETSQEDFFSVVANSIKERIAKLDELQAQLTESNERVATFEAESLKLSRAEKIRSELGLALLSDDTEEVTKVKAEQIEKMTEAAKNLTDEDFDAWLEVQKGLVAIASANQTEKTEASENTDETNENEGEEDEGVTDAAILDGVVASEISSSCR
jgi:hypothetical protein